MAEPGRKRIAIIGGGFAAMSAAWDLTSPSGNGGPEPCEVTIFQMGGRLGGKGASSRNEKLGDRIEEHGLHLWLGYYENAFRMLRRCFDHLQRIDDDPERFSNLDPELREHLQSRPFNNWDWLTAFERASLVGLADYSSGEWTPWVARFPEYVWRGENGVTGIYQWPDGSTPPGVHVVDDRRRAYPGEEPVVLQGGDCEDGEEICLEKPNVAFFLTHALRALQAFVDSLEARIDHLFGPNRHIPDDPETLLSRTLNVNPITHADNLDALMADIPRALRMIRLSILVPAIQAIGTIARLSEGPVPYARSELVAVLDRFIDEMREKIEASIHGDPPARRMWELIDLLAANIRGLVAAGLEGEDDFSSLDDWNYLDWLRFNRVADRTLRNPIVRGAHDLGFAYAGGNAREPQIAAGQAINAGCRFFFMYKGALFWRMKAGMGDVVFAPLYLALRSRGVKFRFFHQLEDIQLAPGTTTVTRLKFRRQLRLKVEGRDVRTLEDVPTNYRPLRSVKGKNMSAWRSTPDEDQFDYDSPTLNEYRRALATPDPGTYLNFESVWCTWPHGDAVYATVGANTADQRKNGWVGHFDDVIVTVPVAALGKVSKDLANHPGEAGRRWRSMVNTLGTVATQSMQLWANKSTRDLGWLYGQVSFSGFVHPFDTWADLSQLRHAENQPDVKSVHYFCSVLPDPHPQQVAGKTDLENLRAAQVLVKQNAKKFLDEWIFRLWHGTADRYPNRFKWDVLVAPKGRIGEARLDAQHLVANVDPSERYTQSLPGTTKHRIRPDETGFSHLFIAGDWTSCGLNFGCVEAAVISGRLASSAVRGYPDTRLIPGYIRPSASVAAANGGR